MRTSMLLAALIPTVASAQAPPFEPARCRPEATRAEDRRMATARPRKLGEMPPARPVLAVDRRVDGCAVLLVMDGGRIVEEPVGRPQMRRTFRP